MSIRFGSWREGVRAYSAYSVVHHAPSTRAMLGAILERFGNHVGGRGPHDVTREDAEAFQALRIAAGASPATVNRETRHLRAFFAWHHDHGFSDGNPFHRLRPLKVIRRRRPIIPRGVITQLIAHLDLRGDRYYADLVRVVANTGLRLGEALHISGEDLDLEAKTLLIRCRDVYATKDREERELPLNAVALEVLLRRKAEAGDSWLFAVRGRLPHKCAVSHGIAKRAAQAGLPGVNWYQLRHAYATYMASQVQPYILAAILGHSSVQTTERNYLHRQHLTLPAPAFVG